MDSSEGRISLRDQVAELKIEKETYREMWLSAQDEVYQLKSDLAAKDKLLRELISEIWFVLSGGDDPTDVCTECGIAGYGALRTKTKEAEQSLTRGGK